MTSVLGINAFHGDASVALVENGKLVAALEEERLNRKKHCAGFPALATKALVRDIHAIDHVAISRNPKANLHKKLLYAATKRPSVTKLVKDRLANVAKVRAVDQELARALGVERLSAKFHNVEHHKAHVASAFFVSPFENAACLSMDGFGDFLSTWRGTGRDRDVDGIDKVEFPHSAGLFYTAITQYLGFHKYGEEWKMMGLAPCGEPKFVDQVRKLIQPTPDGRFKLDLSFFRHHDEGVEMTWDDGSPHLGRVWSDKLVELLGPARDPADPEFYGRWADVARSAQVVYEETFFHVVNDLQQRTGLTDLCLAGGCALNSSANGKLYERTKFKRVFIQPAAGDNGTAIGAAFYVEHAVLGRPRGFVMEHAYLGPSYSDSEVATAVELSRRDANAWSEVEVRHVEDPDLFSTTARAVGEGKIVGWFQGAMEFGPRALGNRSIVADPRRTDMKDILNQRIKRRENYRPFAPSVLAERVGDYFERTEPSPFMLMVYGVRPEKRGEVPAITHTDGTGRLQTVTQAENPRYHALIREFDKQTGVGLVLNTSFNENEPIVCTPAEAIDCFLRTRMDLLAMGNWVLSRKSRA